MGHRITQRIHSCDKCGKTPEDGEFMWYMCNEIWCEECTERHDEEESEGD